jgi:tetratricopeptide (TPR) repeat protein
MHAAKAAILLCLTVATGAGSWYLRVRVPDKQWRLADEAGKRSLDQEYYDKAELQFAAAVEAARGFGDRDRRLGLSLFHLAQALVGQARNCEALSLLERSSAIFEKALGRDHPDVLRVRQYYAAELQKSGRTTEAKARQSISP